MKKLKLNDKVIVITGKDKGKTGSIKSISNKGYVIVSGINFVKKHIKSNPSMQIEGGIVEKESPINVSNVQHFSEKLKVGSRVKIVSVNGKKKRQLVKCGTTLN